MKLCDLPAGHALFKSLEALRQEADEVATSHYLSVQSKSNSLEVWAYKRCESEGLGRAVRAALVAHYQWRIGAVVARLHDLGVEVDDWMPPDDPWAPTGEPGPSP